MGLVIPAGAECTIENVYLTLLALYILREEFDDRKDSWQMLQKKAKDFFKTIGLNNSDRIFRLFTLKTTYPPCPVVK